MGGYRDLDTHMEDFCETREILYMDVYRRAECSGGARNMLQPLVYIPETLQHIDLFIQLPGSSEIGPIGDASSYTRRGG